MAAFASAPGEGRVCHFIIVATRLISSMPRGLLRLRKRNSIGSMPAAAASSSVKLSTAKQLAGLPGERPIVRVGSRVQLQSQQLIGG